MDSPPQTAPPGQPRLRRLLTFGDVLDESMNLFRRHWINFALVSAGSLLPPGLVLVWLSAAGLMSPLFSLAAFQTDRLADSGVTSAQLTQAAAGMLYGLIYSLFGLLWSAAVVVTTDFYLHGEQPALGRVYARAIRRYLSVVLSTVVFVVALTLLTLLAIGAFLVTVFGILGSLIAIVGLLFWWLRPTARRRWLKVIIIVAAPFGLPTYFGARWAMYLCVAVLEGRAPLAALGRSAQLTERHWFRVAGVLTIASLIVGVLLSVLSAFVLVPFSVAALFRGELGLSPTETAISNAVTSVLRILLASIGSIVYTVLFVDLRNRREGTDISERVSQLELSQVPANG